MIVDLETMKAHLGQTLFEDDSLIVGKIEAAQALIERHLGFAIETTYPEAGSPPVSTVPAPLVEAVCQLAAHWYENREATLIGVSGQELPFGVADIVREYRTYTYG